MLSCLDLTIGYDQPLKKNISFELKYGEITFLQGKNGSGKSTLIKTLLGDIKSLSGQVLWCIDKSDASYLAQQTAIESHFSYTVGEVLEIYNVPEKFKKLISPKVMTKNWHKTSGGEKQKAMILTKIKKSTKLLILDEPFNHLDIESTKLINQLLAHLLNSKTILSVLLVSHIKVNIKGVKVNEVLL